MGTHTELGTHGTRVEIPEEDILLLQRLEMTRLEFERRMRHDITPEDEITFDVVSDTRAEYVLDSGLGYPITLAYAQWDLLGVYDAQSWTWAWALLSPPERSRASVVRDVACARMPEFTAHLSITLSDPMLISYIQARLMQTFGYTHIHVQHNAERTFTAFGLRNVHWEPYDPEAHTTQLYYATLAGVRV
jgi:hypothetical protein